MNPFYPFDFQAMQVVRPIEPSSYKRMRTTSNYGDLLESVRAESFTWDSQEGPVIESTLHIHGRERKRPVGDTLHTPQRPIDLGGSLLLRSRARSRSLRAVGITRDPSS